MSNANKEMKELLYLMGVNYRVAINEYDTALFAMIAKEYGFTKFKNAVLVHMKQSDFLPKMSDIERIINGDKSENEKNTKGRAQMAWVHCRSKISRIGAYRSPSEDDISDPVARAAISAMGGWAAFCHVKDDDKTWKEKDFVNYYMNYSQHDIDALPNKPLVGIADNSVQGKGVSEKGMKTILTNLENLKIKKGSGDEKDNV